MADVLTMYADKVVRVTLQGTMLNGGEIWQTGFYLGQAAGEAGAPTQQTADAIRDLWIAFFTNAGNGFHPSYKFEQLKMARLKKDGRYDETPVVVSHPAAPVAGTRGGGPLPPQITLCATLIAGSGKGLGGKGRMYLPGINFGMDDTGHLALNEVQRTCDGLATFFRGVYAAGGPEGVPINASKGSTKFLGAGNRNVPINGVRVGNVYDTQRRRRDAVQEVYAVSGLVGP